MLSIYLEHTSYDEELPDYDGEQYGLSKNESLKNFVDIIAPSIMDFKHRRYYIVGNTYRKVLLSEDIKPKQNKLQYCLKSVKWAV